MVCFDSGRKKCIGTIKTKVNKEIFCLEVNLF